MIPNSTYFSTNIDQVLLPFTDEMSLKLAFLDFDTPTEKAEAISIMNEAAESLPQLTESPSDACIDAILAFSRKTAKN